MKLHKMLGVLKLTIGDTKSASLNGMKAMHLNRLTLDFSGHTAPLENLYREHFVNQTIGLVQISFVLGALIYGIFGVLDAIVMPQQKHITWLLRLAIIGQCMISFALVTFISRMRYYLQFILSILVVNAGLAIVLMIAVAPEPFNYYYYAGLILVLMFGYSLMCLRFIWASLSGWAIVFIYNAGTFLVQIPEQELISNNFFLISVNMFGMFICYLIELNNRRNFFLMHLLAQEQSALLEMSRAAGMAEVATGVLHNVGNVLNSVNVSCTLLMDQLRESRVSNVARVAALMVEPEGDLGHFLTEDPRGRQIPAYLSALANSLQEEHKVMVSESASLYSRIEHIKEIVSMQQSYGRVSGIKETIYPEQLIEDALKLNEGSFLRHKITIRRHYQQVLPVTVDKHKVLQIILNLINNAKSACSNGDGNIGREKIITLRIFNPDPYHVIMQVEDNGTGISPENLTRIFQHGFTTRKDGHGFGLHSGSLAAHELGGSLTVHSDGLGLGATFTLEIPYIRGIEPVNNLKEICP